MDYQLDEDQHLKGLNYSEIWFSRENYKNNITKGTIMSVDINNSLNHLS